MYSKTSEPVHGGSWSVAAYLVWGPHGKCPSHPTVLAPMRWQGFHNGKNLAKIFFLVIWQAKGHLANIGSP